MAGYALQLFAGVVYGLSYVIPESWFNIPNRILNWLFTWPTSDDKRFVKILIVSTLLIPAIFVIILLVMQDDYDILSAVGGTLIATLCGGYIYLKSLIEVYDVKRRYSKLSNLFSGDANRTAWRINAFLFLIFTIVSITAFYIATRLNTLIDSYSELSASNVIIFIIVIPLFFIILFSAFAAIMSLIYITMSIYLLILNRMAQATKGPVWSVVLQLYIIGSTLLIINAANN